MKWSRVQNGVYTAGPYLVEQNAHGWYASGPGLDQQHDTKADAQADAEDAALTRIAGSETTVEPVKGDLVVIPAHDDRRGTVATVLKGDREPMFCLHLARGRKLCLFRREFKVVVP